LRIVTFVGRTGSTLGVRIGSELVDLTPITGNRGMAALLLDGTVAQERIRVFAENAKARLPLKSVTLLPPVMDATKIICLGLNYKDHAAETKMALPNYPSIF
jgi:2-keto-4-pentenoate hydratase/2-oxohepta-3-ene-1,7-dioic acid hydratase in catechol pathway